MPVVHGSFPKRSSRLAGTSIRLRLFHGVPVQRDRKWSSAIKPYSAQQAFERTPGCRCPLVCMGPFNWIRTCDCNLTILVTTCEGGCAMDGEKKATPCTARRALECPVPRRSHGLQGFINTFCKVGVFLAVRLCTLCGDLNACWRSACRRLPVWYWARRFSCEPMHATRESLPWHSKCRRLHVSFDNYWNGITRATVSSQQKCHWFLVTQQTSCCPLHLLPGFRNTPDAQTNRTVHI